MRRNLLWSWATGRRPGRGTLHTVRDVASPQLGNRRDLIVYLPAGYVRSQLRYPVIYMHDGQNLFHADTSFAGPWHVDDAMTSASRHGVAAIVVGIPNMGAHRIDEYSPWATADGTGGGKGDAYLDWIESTVKRLIDLRYRTRTERRWTGIAGSSMGGLISLYGFFRPASLFGFVAALSPSLWFANAAIFSHVATSVHRPGHIYLDAGAREGADVVDSVRRMRDVLTKRGFRDGEEVRLVEDPAGAHHESDWGQRFAEALPWLLEPKGEGTRA
jgi:predicted alpha/beta superfamily hydrolase